jgi:hypothetical protein
VSPHGQLSKIAGPALPGVRAAHGFAFFDSVAGGTDVPPADRSVFLGAEDFYGENVVLVFIRAASRPPANRLSILEQRLAVDGH